MKANFIIDNSIKCVKRNLHFKECQRENRPYVYISPSRKFAWVELDMFPTDRNLDDATRDAIYDAMIEHGVSAKETMCAHVICRAAKVPKAVAESLASCIYNIANNAMPNLKHFCGRNASLVGVS